jgi:hypothetical protein
MNYPTGEPGSVSARRENVTEGRRYGARVFPTPGADATRLAIWLEARMTWRCVNIS